jgi:AcrR family transcriptional regulator
MAERGRPRAFDREEALELAVRLFWERGYEGVSVSELSAAMGINAPSLYAAFGCKEQLFREVVERYEHRHRVDIPEGVPVREAVAGLLRAAALAYTEPDQPRGCLVVQGASNYTVKTEAVRDYLGERRRASRDRLVARLDRAVADGEFSAQVDVQAVAVFYLTVMHGMVQQARDGASKATLLAIAETAMAAWAHLTDPTAG